MTDNVTQSGLGAMPSDRRRRKQALFQKHQASKQANQESGEFSNSKSSLQEDPVEALDSSSMKVLTHEKKKDERIRDGSPASSRSWRGSPDRKIIIKKRLAKKRNSRSGRIDNRDSDDHTSEEDGGGDQISEPTKEKPKLASQSDQIKKLPLSGRRRSPGKKGKIMQQLAEKKRFSRNRSNEGNISASDNSDGQSESASECDNGIVGQGTSANDDSEGQSESASECNDRIEGQGTSANEDSEGQSESISEWDDRIEGQGTSASDDDDGQSEKIEEYEDRIEKQEEQIRPFESTTSQGESDVSANDEENISLMDENSVTEDGPTTLSEVYCHENGVSKSSFEEEEKRLTEGLLERELPQLDQSAPVQEEASDAHKVHAQPIVHEPEAPHALELMQRASKDSGSMDTQIQDLSRTLAHSLLRDKGAEIGVSKDNTAKSESQSADEEFQEEVVKNSQPCDKSRWDTRSILEYPPDPPPMEEKTAETDPSWTTFSSAFDTEVKEIKPLAELDSEVGLAMDIENEFRGDADWSNVKENHIGNVESKSPLHPSLSDNNSEEILEEKVSWDASTALFDPKLSPRKTSDVNTDAAVDMFDTKSWVVSEASSSNNVLGRDKKNKPPEEEKAKASRLQKNKPYPEDAPLLAKNQFRSEDNFGEGITIGNNAEKGALCHLERLAIYNQNDGDQSSLENNEEEEISIDEKSEASGPDEIQYVAADDEEIVLFAEENMEPKSVEPSTAGLVEPAPMFEPASIAADKAELSGNNDDSSSGYYNFDPTSGDSLMTTSSLRGDDSTAYSSLVGEAFAHNGMSVHSTSSSVETNPNKAPTKNSVEKYSSVKARFSIPSLKTRENSGNVVPLIPPPPDDKLRKWEESKQRSSMVLLSSKSDESSVNDIGGKTLGDAAKKENSFVLAGEGNASPKKREGGRFESKTGESSAVVVENEGNGSLPSPTLSDIVSIVTTPSPIRKRSEETTPVHHPSPQMAGKFATATSVAAKTFEQKYLSLNEQETRQSPDESTEVQNDGISSLFCAPYTIADTAASMSNNTAQVPSESNETRSPSSPQKGVSMAANDNESPSRDAGVDLVGGAFNCWNGNLDTSATTEMPELEVDDSSQETTAKKNSMLDNDLVSWLEKDVLVAVPSSQGGGEGNTTEFSNDHIRALLENDKNLNSICIFVADKVNERTKTGKIPASATEISAMSSTSSNVENQSSKTDVQAFQLFGQTNKAPTSSQIHAANFVSFLQRIAKLTGLKSPFGDENPFMLHVVGASLKLPIDEKKEKDICDEKKMQTLVFDHPNGDATSILTFFYNACFFRDSDYVKDNSAELPSRTVPLVHEVTTSSSKVSLGTFDDGEQNRNFIVPDQDICPFELAMCDSPSILLVILSFLGDPQAVCRMKQVNLFCNQIISENEHMVFRDAVRIGGLSMHLRPAFWIWVTLEKFGPNTETPEEGSEKVDQLDIHQLENIGQEGQWHSVISRDVSRAFGNMPPHKTGAHARDDSIVRALVTWGQNRLMKRGVKGGGEADPIPTLQSNSGEPSRPRPVRQTTAPPPWETGDDDSNSDISLTPTVSDWSAISPVGSFNSHFTTADDKLLAKQHSELSRNEKKKVHRSQRKFAKELALSGNALNNDMKVDLQNKLGFILHALAAAHDSVGYCQGMDYVVAHLLRVLQETIVWQARRGALSSTIISAKKGERMSRTAVEDSCVVEETVFRVMNSLLTTYNLRHMYWPELRCLKTVCRVFEKLIQLKLPVLADHFDHHELNIGMFALGWFQTLFLYLPSMPAKTVCHMWDIWLVERSFKIFFRVGTAILFLSQPILLNHELEGMMTYLNTFPDATLLRPDILIACALQIKVTNKMLLQFETEVTGGI